MAQPFTTVLWVSLLGMGIVFAAILLLWVVIVLIMRFAPHKEPGALSAEAETEMTRKRRAAAAAVAAALAFKKMTGPQEFPEPPTAIVSAWQLLMRTRMLNKRGPIR